MPSSSSTNTDSSPISASEDLEMGTREATTENHSGFPGMIELVAQEPDQGPNVFRKLSKSERSTENPPSGFPGMAELVAQDPDQETYVFRKFSKLTAWNLIFKQTELTGYEREVDAIEAELASDGKSNYMAKRWEIFYNEAQVAGTPANRMSELSGRISRKLSEYHSALSAASSVAQLKQPNVRVLKVLSEFAGAADVDGDLIADYLKHQNKKDLVALKVSSDNDAMTTLLRDQVSWLWKTKASDHKTDSTRFFKDGRITITTRILSVGLAATLLVGSILALYFVTDDATRLGILLVFIITFAFGVATTTSASRDSIFAATAAYAAVLIVFISGDLSNSNSTTASTATAGLEEAIKEALASISA